MKKIDFKFVMILFMPFFCIGFIVGWSAKSNPNPTQNQTNYEEMSQQITNQLFSSDDYIEIKARMEGKYLVYYFDAADPVGLISRIPIDMGKQ